MKILLAVALTGGSIVWAADSIPLDVKTGQWENTVTTQISGVPQSAQQQSATASIPPEQLAKLPPAQRAKIEAAMGALSGKPMTNISKSCLKKEDLAKYIPNANKNQSCKTTIVSSSRTKQEIKMDCENNSGSQSGTLVVEVLSPESTKFNLQMTASKGQGMNMTVSGTSKWLGETCTDTK
jgi:Protein of unknown function (DUF3617)